MEKTKAHIIIEKIAKLISHNYNPFEFKSNILHLNDNTDEDDIVTLTNDLIETGNKIQLMLIQHYSTQEDFLAILRKFDFDTVLPVGSSNDADVSRVNVGVAVIPSGFSSSKYFS